MARKIKKDEVVEVTVDVATEEKPQQEEQEVVVVEQPAKEEVEVDIESTVSAPKKKDPNKKVRICMREDHQCFIGTENYDLKKGQCYNVPESVKRILNKAGLLLPL